MPSMRPPTLASPTAEPTDARVVELRVRIQPEAAAADRSGDVLEAVLQCLRQYGWRPTFVAMGPAEGGVSAR